METSSSSLNKDLSLKNNQLASARLISKINCQREP
jgi:hypothetical protein